MGSRGLPRSDNTSCIAGQRWPTDLPRGASWPFMMAPCTAPPRSKRPLEKQVRRGRNRVPNADTPAEESVGVGWALERALEGTGAGSLTVRGLVRVAAASDGMQQGPRQPSSVRLAPAVAA